MEDIPADFLSLELFEGHCFSQGKRRTWRLIEAAVTTSWHMPGIFQGDMNS
jgi:hypothetical protein